MLKTSVCKKLVRFRTKGVEVRFHAPKKGVPQVVWLEEHPFVYNVLSERQLAPSVGSNQCDIGLTGV